MPRPVERRYVNKTKAQALLQPGQRGLANPQAKVMRAWANEKQAWLYHRGPAPTALLGGQNSGKSVACVLKLLTLLQTYPGSRAAIIRRSNIQLTKTTMETWFQWCGPGFYRPFGTFNQNSGVLDFNNGSRVYFLHLDQPDSLDVVKGLDLNFAYVSQVEEISETAWDLLEVRCGRWTGATIPDEVFAAYPGARAAWPWKSEEGDVHVPPRYIFAEGYVTDETHWLYKRFADPSNYPGCIASADRSKWKALGYEAQIVNSSENRFAVKSVNDSLYAKDSDYIRRLVDPKWGNPEGQIFTISPLSELQPTPALLNRLRLFCRWHWSMDHGDTAPVCVLWYAVDADGRIYCVREYYAGNLLVTQHRKALFELRKDDPPYHSSFADPSIFSISRGRSATSRPEWRISDEWRDPRIGDPRTTIAWQRSINDEAATRSRVKEYLAVDPRVRHPLTNELGAPRLYFIVATPDYPHGCNMVLKEVRAQRLKAVSISADVKIFSDDRDDTVVDHSYDALKYFLVMRAGPAPAELPPPTPPGEISLKEYNEAGVEARRRRGRETRMKGGAKGIKYGF